MYDDSFVVLSFRLPLLCFCLLADGLATHLGLVETELVVVGVLVCNPFPAHFPYTFTYHTVFVLLARAISLAQLMSQHSNLGSRIDMKKGGIPFLLLLRMDHTMNQHTRSHD